MTLSSQASPPPEPAYGTAAAMGHNSHLTEAEDLVAAFTDTLVGPRSKDTICFLDSIIEKTRPNQDLRSTTPDVILMDLFLYRSDLLPRFDNTICAELGRLVEQLVTAVFTKTRPEHVVHGKTGLDHLEAEYAADPVRFRKKGQKARTVKWKFPDFQLAGDTLIEVKYRFNSYQNKQAQIEAAHAYRKLGKRPVFLHISPDCKQIADFVAAGWEVHVGQDAIDYINDHAGIDFRSILRRVAAQPAVRRRLEEGQQRIERRLAARHLRDFEFGTDAMRTAIYDKIASDDRHTSEVIKRRSDISEEMLEKIRRQSEDSMEHRIENLTELDQHIDEIGSIIGSIGKLNNEKQAETLRRLGAMLTDTQRDEFIASWG